MAGSVARAQIVSMLPANALELDGDLVRHGPGAETPGSTETAVRTLGPRLEMSERAIRRDLERRTLPRASVLRIKLQSPKITRPLTTEWFANRVDERDRRCVAQAG